MISRFTRPGVGDNLPRATGEERALEFQDFSMLSLPSAHQLAPGRLIARPAFQPRRVHAVARAVGIAFPDPFEAQEKIAAVLRGEVTDICGRNPQLPTRATTPA